MARAGVVPIRTTHRTPSPGTVPNTVRLTFFDLVLICCQKTHVLWLANTAEAVKESKMSDVIALIRCLIGSGGEGGEGGVRLCTYMYI